MTEYPMTPDDTLRHSPHRAHPELSPRCILPAKQYVVLKRWGQDRQATQQGVQILEPWSCWMGEMAQQENAPAAKTDSLSSSPGTRVVDGEN